MLMVTSHSGRWTVIRMICGSATPPGKLREVAPDSGIYEVFWSDPAGCPVQMSIGTIFLIVFVSINVVYFGGGTFASYRTSGQATIPHADFWYALPDLCKDGYFYAKDGTSGLSGPTGAQKSEYQGL